MKENEWWLCRMMIESLTHGCWVSWATSAAQASPECWTPPCKSPCQYCPDPRPVQIASASARPTTNDNLQKIRVKLVPLTNYRNNLNWLNQVYFVQQNTTSAIGCRISHAAIKFDNDNALWWRTLKPPWSLKWCKFYPRIHQTNSVGNCI